MTIIKKTSTKHTAAKANRKIEYIVIHYTAGTRSTKGTAYNVVNGWMNSTREASADFVVDDALIVQYNPDPKNRYCYAVGGAKSNNKGGSLYGKAKNTNCVSIELCSTNDTGKITSANDAHFSFTASVVDRAVELTEHLMKEYGIDAAHVIRHYDVTGKYCPGIIGWNAESGSEAGWIMFKARITPKKEEPTDREYIDVLVKAGVITNTGLWERKMQEDVNVYWLIRKMAERIGL